MLKSMVQQLAYRGWHRVNRQAKRVADWSGGGGWWSWVSSATGDRGQTAVSLTPDDCGTGSGFLLDSILSTLLKKTTQWCLDSSSPFLIIDDTVAVVCILKGCCSLHVLMFGSHASETDSASSDRTNVGGWTCEYMLSLTVCNLKVCM